MIFKIYIFVQLNEIMGLKKYIKNRIRNLDNKISKCEDTKVKEILEEMRRNEIRQNGIFLHY